METINNDVIENSYVNCTGCGNCVNICPKNAIYMEKNEEGFFYPKIDKKKCVGCNLCKRKCPSINLNKNVGNTVSYAYCSNNNENWTASSSGGAFSDICAIWETKYPGSHYYGATIDNQHNVKHICVKFNDLYKIKKSKYAQSDIDYSFKKVKDDLINGIPVVFTGTPCQISGLKSFLGKNYKELLLIDFVCHGVGSNEVLKECIKITENKIGKKIIKYTFRHKNIKNFKASKRYSVEYMLDDFTTLVNDNDNYINLFLMGKCLRNSCSNNCKFKASNSNSDISLADLNNKSSILPKIYDKRNYSAIFFHTDKKIIFVDSMKKYGTFIKCNIDDIVKYNKVYNSNNDCADTRKSFFDSYKNNKEKAIVNNSLQKMNNSRLSDSVPYFIKYVFNNIKGIVKNGRK
ncbi:MAG: Coenzyme F420 hydrogenase/dehydrogenase, beta subunit C-terminal domain [Bacilli bacterium]